MELFIPGDESIEWEQKVLRWCSAPGCGWQFETFLPVDFPENSPLTDDILFAIGYHFKIHNEKAHQGTARLIP